MEKEKPNKGRNGIKPAKRKNKAESTAAVDSNPERKKGPKFHTAAAVHNRLKHDFLWDIDEYVFGYLDRHKENIIERPARNWVRESTEEEFIPEHRVQYFKKIGGDFLWHKSKRIDEMFEPTVPSSSNQDSQT